MLEMTAMKSQAVHVSPALLRQADYEKIWDKHEVMKIGNTLVRWHMIEGGVLRRSLAVRDGN